MNEYGLKAKDATLASIGLKNVSAAYWNLSPAELVEETIVLGQGVLADSGALAVDTGEFTGRSPRDKFVVCDEKTENSVWWGDINIKFDADKIRPLVSPH
jgi:phosphoenolpyruvate carboxykinase (ATP)